MQFGFENRPMQLMKSGKTEIIEGIEISNPESIKPLGEKEN